MANYRIFCASPLLLSALLLSRVFPAHAASFDCQQAVSQVEQAICTTPPLGNLDERLSSHYQQLMAATPQSAQPALRSTQRSWLKQRNVCSGDRSRLNACLTQQLSQRDRELIQQLSQAQQVLDATIATIPAHPAQAAAALKLYHSALPAAWLVYLNQFVPASGVSAQEAAQAQTIADTTLRKENKYGWSILQDMRKNATSPRANRVLLLLRLIIEQQDYNQTGDDDKIRDYVHCFIFARLGGPAYDAFGPLYGSTRDSFAPICPPQGNVFEQPAWQQLRSPLRGSGQVNGAGSIRFANSAAWRIIELRATTTPQDFLSGTSAAPTQQDPVQRINAWGDDQNWPASQRQQTLIAIKPAEVTTARWLEQERGFSAGDAQTAASKIVRQWLNQHLDYLAASAG